MFSVDKVGNRPLKTIKCLAFLICPTLVPSLGGTSLICHLSGPLQSPKVSKNTIKITSFCHAVFLMSKEANSLLKTIKCPIPSPICHPRGPSEPQSSHEYHISHRKCIISQQVNSLLPARWYLMTVWSLLFGLTTLGLYDQHSALHCKAFQGLFGLFLSTRSGRFFFFPN